MSKKQNTAAHSPVGLEYAAKKLGIQMDTLLFCIERGDFQCARDDDGNVVEVFLPGKEPAVEPEIGGLFGKVIEVVKAPANDGAAE